MMTMIWRTEKTIDVSLTSAYLFDLVFDLYVVHVHITFLVSIKLNSLKSAWKTRNFNIFVQFFAFELMLLISQEFIFAD